ncbi:hypothetical protein K458DRAFT_410679 [Lentithecium fluviatile CBS 122367]|uniref:Uncharacterized protein n=1 Tax=Lentithecium fluviatile CBS 122367 TaxID=1168545 RepID=A0A6G1ID95_9PLEO|nr:hypothetical protein K458DRAFT_410679 [Lentithecium fluviatile CBS 122367]
MPRQLVPDFQHFRLFTALFQSTLYSSVSDPCDEKVHLRSPVQFSPLNYQYNIKEDPQVSSVGVLLCSLRETMKPCLETQLSLRFGQHNILWVPKEVQEVSFITGFREIHDLFLSVQGMSTSSNDTNRSITLLATSGSRRATISICGSPSSDHRAIRAHNPTKGSA